MGHVNFQRRQGGGTGQRLGACRRIIGMKALKHFIADIRSRTEEALETHEVRGLMAHNITVRCVPVVAPDGEPCIVYTVNGKRATLGQAARQLKAAEDAAG